MSSFSIRVKYRISATSSHLTPRINRCPLISRRCSFEVKKAVEDCWWSGEAIVLSKTLYKVFCWSRKRKRDGYMALFCSSFRSSLFGEPFLSCLFEGSFSETDGSKFDI